MHFGKNIGFRAIGIITVFLFVGALWACSEPPSGKPDGTTTEVTGGGETGTGGTDAGATDQGGGTPDQTTQPEPTVNNDQGGGTPDQGGGTPDQVTQPDQPAQPDQGGGGQVTDKTLPPPPKGAPAPKAYSGGTCPVIKAGKLTFQSGGKARTVNVYLPQTTKGAGLLFLWHGLGDSPDRFANAVGAQNLANKHNVIVIVPKGVSGPIIPKTVPPAMASIFKSQAPQVFETWSFFGNPTVDLTLFDDLVNCTDTNFDIDNMRIYSSGFSAGSLWTTILTMERSEYLAATAIFSGGTLDQEVDLSKLLPSLQGKMKVVSNPYKSPTRKIPVMVAWGGTSDSISLGGIIKIDFNQAGLNLSNGLNKDKHVVVKCVHTTGHKLPSALLLAGIDFIFKHKLDTKPSPFAPGTVPPSYPQYCNVMKAAP